MISLTNGIGGVGDAKGTKKGDGNRDDVFGMQAVEENSM
jgi:hypothetical protein